MNWILPIILVVVAGSVGAGILTLQTGLPSSPCATVQGGVRNFTIIADSHGFNNSMDHNGNGPYLTVSRCDTVLITVINKDTQVHGFVVDYYAPRGLDLVGGSQQTFRFLAIRSGEFVIKCNSFCLIHSFMLHGLLTVT